MICPVCLSFGLTAIEATVQVSGTQYCPQHGVEALAATSSRQLRTPASRSAPFSPPLPPPVED